MKILTGWRLDRAQRTELLQQFPPRYANIVADHVTLKFGSGAGDPDAWPAHGEIVGRVDDGQGVEAMIVRLDGSTERPDGSTWHITWSLADGRKAKESNDVLKAAEWQMFDLPMPLLLAPSRWS